MLHKGLVILFSFLYSILFITAYGQESGSRFRIVNEKNEPVPLATVSVISVEDTLSTWSNVSDSMGRVSFTLTTGKPYLVKISSINYRPFEKSILVKNEINEFTFQLVEGSKALTGVVVTASRPLLRQEDDKTIVDPESLAAMSTNAYEIMEKTPGIFVDQDGNVYLSSTTPATIYINGREQKMSAADIATMLKNLPPTAIASIEIMRTPSAKYDASGSGGIINVILKKGVRIGLTGSATLGLNQGQYGNQFIGINLNNNNGRVTTYLNMQYGRRNSLDEINTNRLYTADSVLSQEAATRYSTANYYIGYGIGYEINKKWELNYDGRLSYSHSSNYTENLSWRSKTGTGTVLQPFLAKVTNKGKNLNLNQGLNLKYKIDSLGSEWTTDLSFSYSPNHTDQVFNTGDGDLENRLQFFSAQTNYLKKFSRKLTLETGLKTTALSFRNNTDYYSAIGGTRIKDLSRTGAYNYRENIHSAYLQASRNFSGIIIKAGTRLEHTDMKGIQELPADTSFSIRRTDLFPYIYISKTIMTIAGFDLRAYLVYRRTISRPAYEYLNPSIRFIDPYLYESGNPTLRPQFTHNYEANISVDERPILAIGVNDTKDIFTQVMYPAPANGNDSAKAVSYRTYDNLGNNKETYIRLLGAIPPGKRYFFVAGAQYNHNHYQGLYENKPLSFKKGSWTLFTYHNFKITPLTQLSMNGFVRFNGQQQFYELSTFGEMRMSLNQQLLKKKLNLTISVSDIFRTNTNEFRIRQGSIDAWGMRRGDTRRFGLNLRYNFGWRKKEESNNMFTVESPEGKN